MADLSEKVKPRILTRVFKGIVKGVIGLGLFTILFLAVGYLLVEAPRYDGFAVSPVLLDKDGEALYAGLSSDEEIAMPVSLGRMGETLPRIAVGVEDKRFYSHFGVDPLALARAVYQNVKNGRVISGASTITVQLVRLSKPRPRNFWSKLVEFLEAVKLERKLSKESILEIYLNRAPFGGNVRGVGAASAIYFGKKPAELTLGESAVLVALLRGPAIYRPDRWPERAKARRDLVLSVLRRKGLISQSDQDAASQERITGERFSPPRKAFHLAAYLLDPPESPRWRWGAPGYGGEPTSIDPALQDNLEKNLLLALNPFPNEVNGAGILVSNQTGLVLAYVGGVRNEGPTFHVDNARSRRSPGSTLKPFVYLAAFADGTLGPSEVLAEGEKESFDRSGESFNDPKAAPSAEDPLAVDQDLAASAAASNPAEGQASGPSGSGPSGSVDGPGSLYAPTIRVLRLIGQERALEVLKTMGLTIDADRDYGDSLAYGGLETSMLELAGAYATLAKGGVAVRPGFDPKGEYLGPRLFSEEAVWLINQSLSTDRGLESSGALLAFESGTSHNQTDAWLAVYDPGHTLVLWLGDPTGRGHSGLMEAAGLLEAGTKYMGELGQKTPWPDPPEGLERFGACPLTGDPVTPHCPGVKWAWRMKTLAKSLPCGLHGRPEGQGATLWPTGPLKFLGF
ncbi:MAG: transglycosylase domain-containing protein [Deltaproteobacteria bacterium]|jgi:penicillin-binding protein 1C|nr:transglycosylase domain-containing protein [Deltaproteobacteria bacterium]